MPWAAIAKSLGIAVAAYFGGNVVFGILADGTWVLGAAFAFLPEWLFDALAVGLLWACRIGVFLSLVFMWAQQARQRNPQAAN